LKAKVICDGRGNGGTGACAAVLYMDGNVLSTDQRARKIEPTTNIVAEHLAIQLAMELALEHGVTDLLILNDSQTPVNHVLGTYKCEKPHLIPILEQTWEMGKRFDSVSIKWVPREETSVADKLCRQVDVRPAKRSRPGGAPPAPPQRKNPFRPAG
jgi:ribonuclease HI